MRGATHRRAPADRPLLRSSDVLRACGLAGVCLLIGMVGCTPGPVSRGADAAIQRTLVDTIRRELREPGQRPEPIRTERQSTAASLRIDDRVMPELESMAGPGAHSLDPADLPLGDDLLGNPQRVVAISLERAIRSAVERNLEVQFARLAPAVAESQLVAAESAFDWVLFSTLEYNRTDTPIAATSTFGIQSGATATDQNTVSSTLGVRRQLIAGGSLTLQQAITYLDDRSPGRELDPDPSWRLGLTAQIDQPLLRGFGTNVAQAEIRLARNAERASVAALQSELSRIVTETEAAYWELYRAHRDLLILQRLFERGVQVRDQVIERVRIDASRAQIASAVARVEARRADVLRAQSALRRASDRLKVLINDESFPVGSEALLIPADDAVDEAIEFSLFDAIATAMEHRPEITRAVLSIDDTSIRRTVAENLRLPTLDLRLQARFEELQSDLGDAYEEIVDGTFISALVGLFFEQPIGNRPGESAARQRRLERMQAVISYRNTVQQIVLELKVALDTVRLNYRLIEQTRVSRLAAAEVLRALQVEKQLLRGFTIEFLDLELNRQESLAASERQELQALVDYNTAIANYYAALGLGLERNGILFDVPDPGEVIETDTTLRDHR